MTKVPMRSAASEGPLGRRGFLTGGLVAGALAVSAPAAQAAKVRAAGPAATHNTARNRFVEAAGVRFAYRRLGPAQGRPVVLLQHFIGTMDWWDPRLIDALAKSRPVIIFDNRGVGLSSGQTPETVDAMAEDTAAFIRALGLKEVDVLGFSIGGMVAQELTLRNPDLVRRLILAGTGPRGGDGMRETRPDIVKALSVPDPSLARPYLFFSQTASSQAAAQAFMKRVSERKIDLDPRSTMQTFQAQGVALNAWGDPASAAGYRERLKTLRQPVLVVNGDNDIMVFTSNTIALSKAIPKAELIIYPDSGHGGIFQYAELFAEHARLFLDRNDAGLS